MGSNPAGCTIFFAFFKSRKQSRKKQILILTNCFVRQDFFFSPNIFCNKKNGIAYFVAGCPALLDLALCDARALRRFAPRRIRRVYHFRHLSARVYNFCGFFVICCKMLQKPAHRSRNYGIFTARLRHTSTVIRVVTLRLYAFYSPKIPFLMASCRNFAVI